MRRALSIFDFSLKNISILVFFAGVMTQLIYYLMQVNSAADEQSPQLLPPSNCSDFQLVSGNLHNASVVLLGESHDLQQLTLKCLTALITCLPLYKAGFDTYLEGSTDTYISQNARSMAICNGATRCLSWDHEDAFAKSQQMIMASAMVNMIYYIFDTQTKHGLDDKAMHGLVVTPAFENQLLNYFYKIEGQFMFGHYQHLFSQVKQVLTSNSKVSLQDIAKSNFDRMQKAFGLPAEIVKGSIKEVANAIFKALSADGVVFSLLETIRDKKLLVHIKNAFRPSFFIAGFAHFENIRNGIANNSSVAVLTIKPGK